MQVDGGPWQPLAVVSVTPPTTYYRFAEHPQFAPPGAHTFTFRARRAGDTTWVTSAPFPWTVIAPIMALTLDALHSEGGCFPRVTYQTKEAFTRLWLEFDEDAGQRVKLDEFVLTSLPVGADYHPWSQTLYRFYRDLVPDARRDGQSHTVRAVAESYGRFYGHSDARAALTVSSAPLVLRFNEPLGAGSDVPPMPSAINARRVRQADVNAPDQVELRWTATTMIQIVAAVEGDEKILGYADSRDDHLVLHNTRRFLPLTGQRHRVAFGIRGYCAGRVSPLCWSDSLEILARSPAPRNPDQDAGTAITWQPPDWMPSVQAQLAQAFPATPPAQHTTLLALITDALTTRIKTVIAHGGRVTLANFGDFQATWRPARLNARGALLPAERQVRFVPSPGFLAGVKAGVVMTDAEATPP